MYAKKVWYNTNFFILNVALNIIFNIPLIYFYGIIGAAIATLLSSSIILFFSLYFSKKFAPIYYKKKNYENFYFVFPQVFIQF